MRLLASGESLSGDCLKESAWRAEDMAEVVGGTDADPWPRRLLLIGVVLMAIGLGAYASGWKEIEAAIDPSINNLAALEPGESSEVELIEAGSYTALRVLPADGEPVPALDMVRLTDGSTLPGEEPTWTSASRNDANGTMYSPVRIWMIQQAGPHMFRNDDEAAGTLYLVDESADDMAAMSSPTFLLGCMICLAGFGLLPIAAAVRWLNRRSEPVRVIIDSGGGFVVDGDAPGQPTIVPGVAQPLDDDSMFDEVADHADLTPYLTAGRIPTTEELWSAQRAWEADRSMGDIVEAVVAVDGDAIERFDSGVMAPFADRPDPPLQRPVGGRRQVSDSQAEASDPKSKDGRGWLDWDEG